jgi:hypothetical protein
MLSEKDGNFILVGHYYTVLSPLSAHSNLHCSTYLPLHQNTTTQPVFNDAIEV